MKRRFHAFNILTLSVAFAVAPAAHADTWGNTKNALGKAVECIKDSTKAGLITADAASKILGIMADPQGAACIAQVTMPDVITIGVSAAMVIANTQGKLHQGTCQAELRDAAFEPFVDGIGTFTGLSMDKEPLKSLVAKGKDEAWTYLNTTPPASLVLSKVSCGCIFIDNGVSYETAAKIAKAYTAAGESCAGFAEAAAKVVCEASNDTKAACKLIGSAATALNNAGESLFQDSAVPWEEYYDTWWKYFESSYIEQSIAKGSPIGTDVKMKAKNGHAQVDPMAYNNKTIAEARKDSEIYFDNHKNSNASAKERGGWLEQRFRANAQPFVDAGIKYGKFAALAKAHAAKRVDQWENEVAASSYYSKQVAKLIEIPKPGTVELDNSVVPGGGGKVWLWVFLPNGSLTLPGYTGKAYKIWMQSTGGDESQINAVLDLAYNEASEKLTELVASYKKETQAAKNKDFVIPVRILVGDGAVEKLGKVSEEGTCNGLNEVIMPYCASRAGDIVASAKAERKSRLREPLLDGPGSNYGQSQDGKYKYFDPIYKYDAIKVRDDWTVGTKYDAVLNQAADRVAFYQDRLKNLGDSFKNINLKHNILTEQWTWQCGAAIGKPDTKPTPLCENFVASAVASCLTKGPVLEMALSDVGGKAAAGGVDLSGGVKSAVSKGTTSGGNAGSANTNNKSSESKNSGKGASATQQAGKGTPNVDATKAGAQSNWGVGLKPSECAAEVETALAQYAQRHAISPANDKPYPTTMVALQDAKSSAKNPSLLGLGMIPEKSAGPKSLPRSKSGDEDAKKEGAKESTKDGGLFVKKLEKIGDDSKDSGRTLRVARPGEASGSEDASKAPLLIDPKKGKITLGDTPEGRPPVDSRGTASALPTQPASRIGAPAGANPALAIEPQRQASDARGTTVTPPAAGHASATGSAPAPQVPAGGQIAAAHSVTQPAAQPSARTAGTPPAPATAPVPPAPTPPAQARSTPPATPPAAPAAVTPAPAPTPAVTTAMAKPPSSAGGISAPGTPPAGGLTIAPAAGASDTEAELAKAGCKPVTGQRGSYSCATKQGFDVCEGLKKQNKVGACAQGR